MKAIKLNTRFIAEKKAAIKRDIVTKSVELKRNVNCEYVSANKIDLK